MNGFSHDSKVPRPLSPDRTQQMILARPCLRRQITKHLTLLMIYPSHASTPEWLRNSLLCTSDSTSCNRIDTSICSSGKKHWAIVDLIDKRGHVRTVLLPDSE